MRTQWWARRFVVLVAQRSLAADVKSILALEVLVEGFAEAVRVTLDNVTSLVEFLSR